MTDHLDMASTTSAGVTEEQTPRTCTCHPSDNPPVPCAERYALSDCLEASRVAPVSQKEAVIVATMHQRGPVTLFSNGYVPNMLGFTSSPLYPAPAPAGQPVGIKADDRLYNADEPMADGEVEMTAAENVLGWLIIEKIGVPDDRNYSPNEAQEILVHRLDYANELENESLRSALHTTPTPVSAPVGVVEALRQLEVKAIGQRDYFNAKQRGLPSIEDFTNEDGNVSLPADIAPLLRQVEANGRYSESSWWVATIQERIRAALVAPSASAQGGEL